MSQDTKTCSTCRHWDRASLKAEYITVHGRCRLLVSVRSEAIAPDYDLYRLVSTHGEMPLPLNGAGPQDDWGGHELATGPEFGCVRWEAKEQGNV